MSISRIACCIDFSPNADTAFKRALTSAEQFQATLSLVHVLPPVVNPMQAETEPMLPDVEPKSTLTLKLEERMQQKYGDVISETAIPFELAVLDGHISTEIIRFLEERDIDLVVMGSYGFTGMGLVFFGSVAKRVSHRAPCSVMIVRDKQ